jgi:NAD(P)-dependent dehydrogenase (short-subunit alcohol dehydrogenase family)
VAHAALVLVTGSAGRIGQAVVRELQARGHPVRGFDRVPTPGLEDAVVGDLADAGAVGRAVTGTGTVIHLAATPDDDDFLTQLLPNNIIGPYHVIEAARQAGVGRLVLASSGQVTWWQRERGPWPIRPDAPPSPRAWYAAAKLFVEAAGCALAEQGVSVIAARLGWCPRTPEHARELAATPWGPDVYFSPGDAGRFFACAVEAPADIRFAVVYATSKPAQHLLYDLQPARELLGYEPRDRWPEDSGSDELAPD